MNVFHAGELAVQSLAGVRDEAEHLSSMVSSGLIKPAAREFLKTPRFAIAASVDRENRVWASLLTGEPGFVQAIADHTVQVQADAIAGPFQQALQAHAEIGLLVIDLATRRRLRLNGQVEQTDDRLLIHTRQAYFNCPKYIQLRHLTVAERSVTERSESPDIRQSTTLSPAQQQWISQADTFFIASLHPTHGADASHRGGYPGFVQVDSERLVFPDYSGNNMFNTLGNLQVNPSAGLLFIDFEQGHTLQLTGTATIVWEPERIAAVAGAERLVEFQIQQVRQTSFASGLRWQFVEYSPANPVLSGH